MKRWHGFIGASNENLSLMANRQNDLRLFDDAIYRFAHWLAEKKTDWDTVRWFNELWMICPPVRNDGPVNYF